MRSAVIKKRQVNLRRETFLVGQSSSGVSHEEAEPCSALGAPGVEVLRDGETIQAIEVTCPCGHVMVLDCVWDSPSEAPDETSSTAAQQDDGTPAD